MNSAGQMNSCSDQLKVYLPLKYRRSSNYVSAKKKNFFFLLREKKPWNTYIYASLEIQLSMQIFFLIRLIEYSNRIFLSQEVSIFFSNRINICTVNKFAIFIFSIFNLQVKKLVYFFVSKKFQERDIEREVKKKMYESRIFQLFLP